MRNCMDFTLFNMYVKVSLLFTSCHLNATGVVFVNVIQSRSHKISQPSLDCIMAESYRMQVLCGRSRNAGPSQSGLWPSSAVKTRKKSNGCASVEPHSTWLIAQYDKLN